MRQLEGDADAGEMGAWVAAHLRGEHDAVGQRALHLMMVGDDDVHAQLSGARHFVPRRDAAVDGDQQAHAGGGELFDRRRPRARTLGETVRQARAHVGAKLVEDALQKKGRRDAVGVVVAVDGDGFVALQGLVDARASRRHARHRVGVVDAEVGVQEGAGILRVDESPAHEDLRQHLADAELSANLRTCGIRRRGDAPGDLIGHESFTRASVPRGTATDDDARRRGRSVRRHRRRLDSRGDDGRRFGGRHDGRRLVGRLSGLRGRSRWLRRAPPPRRSPVGLRRCLGLLGLRRRRRLRRQTRASAARSRS